MPRWTYLFPTIFAPAVIGVVISLVAGRWDLPFVWAILGCMAGFFVLLAVFADRDLMRERVAPGPGNHDRLTRPLGALLLLTHWVLVGLDVGRFHWSPVPWELQLAGVIGYFTALSINFWALRTNRFYSSVVRVQADRGQVVIDTGPYRFVRHPGYTATLCAMFCGGVALGSWMAILPVFGFAALFLRRTLVEDRLLQQELPGYVEYAQRVRSRLIPGVF